ncbi:hypothetical protein BN1708_016243 [Verticillium longisporum]|uniref:Uncharacterized protein n=1 Tax=Verticillium longisporum TaxID=100787 RepID=A0A0G4MG86_VERLO|nr:hypothetical protein BN1708_016243 [Verticillium longisporum]
MPSESEKASGFHDHDNQFSHTRASSGDTEDFTNDPRYGTLNQVHQKEEHDGDKRTSFASMRTSEHPILYYSEHSTIHHSKRKRPELDESDGSRSPRAQRQRVNGVSDPRDNAYDQPSSKKGKIGPPRDRLSDPSLCSQPQPRCTNVSEGFISATVHPGPEENYSRPFPDDNSEKSQIDDGGLQTHSLWPLVACPRRSYSLAVILDDEPEARNAERHNRLPRQRDPLSQDYGDHVERGLRVSPEEDAIGDAQANDGSELPLTSGSAFQHPSPYLIPGPSGLSAQPTQEVFRLNPSPVLSTVSDDPPCFTLSSVVAIARDKRTSVACKYCRKRKPLLLIPPGLLEGRSEGLYNGPSAQPLLSKSTGLFLDTQPVRSLYNRTSLTPIMDSSLQPESTGSGHSLERSHTTPESDIQEGGLSLDAPSNIH